MDDKTKDRASPPEQIAFAKAQRTLIRALAHPRTLEERVAALEHDLAIIAQIIIGKKPDGEL